VDESSTARILAALRVLTTYYKFGQTASLEDMDNVRRWASDESLSAPDAAMIVVRRELERRDRESPRNNLGEAP
jgi:hypothetical protein